MGHGEQNARPSSPGWQNVETPFFKASCLEQGQTQASAEILAASFPREPVSRTPSFTCGVAARS